MPVESHTLLSHLAEAWAYVTLGASGIITEEAAPIHVEGTFDIPCRAAVLESDCATATNQ